MRTQDFQSLTNMHVKANLNVTLNTMKNFAMGNPPISSLVVRLGIEIFKNIKTYGTLMRKFLKC